MNSSDRRKKQFSNALEILKKRGISAMEYLALECCSTPRGHVGASCCYCGGIVIRDWDECEKEEIAVFPD
jgi:hypothetical protein